MKKKINHPLSFKNIKKIEKYDPITQGLKTMRNSISSTGLKGIFKNSPSFVMNKINKKGMI